MRVSCHSFDCRVVYARGAYLGISICRLNRACVASPPAAHRGARERGFNVEYLEHEHVAPLAPSLMAGPCWFCIDTLQRDSLRDSLRSMRGFRGRHIHPPGLRRRPSGAPGATPTPGRRLKAKHCPPPPPFNCLLDPLLLRRPCKHEVPNHCVR